MNETERQREPEKPGVEGNSRFLMQRIEHSGALVFVKDREGRYVLVNRKWEEVTGLSRLINDLLSFSRMGRTEIRQVRVPMEDLVRQAAEVAEREAGGREVVWRIDPLPVVEGDAEMLRLVVANLLSNAIKYTQGRTPAVIRIGSVHHAREVVFFVRDNGVGFDMRYVDRLFGVFQRLHSAAEFEGTGIGLANVRRIVSRHGGRTWAEGTVGHGATFFFSFPHPTPDRSR